MTDKQLTQYRELRPYIRALLALLFYCMTRNRSLEHPNPMASYFTEADAFLTEFEMRRNS